MSVVSFPDTEPASYSGVTPRNQDDIHASYTQCKLPYADQSTAWKVPGAQNSKAVRVDDHHSGLTPKPLNLVHKTSEMDELRKMMETLTSKVAMLSNGSPVAGKTNTELFPDDSASTLERYNSGRKFWKPDYNIPENIVESPEERDIEQIMSQQTTSGDYTTVVRGFVKDRPICFRETRIARSIGTVKGLQQVFVNDRLNFLAHLHNALHRMDTNSQTYPPENLLYHLQRVCRKTPDTPQKELLKLVVQTTIDFEDMIVIANQFKIPILEVGMRLSERYVYLAFDKLNHEYEMEWFETTKDLHVPTFHSKYSTKSDTYLSLGKVKDSNSPKRSQTILSMNTSSSHNTGTRKRFF